jgi:peroxiredoxin Q/BCP
MTSIRAAIQAFMSALIRPRRTTIMLNPGDVAPDFVGRDHTGQAVKLSDFRGKTVVLWFFPKADTPG